MTRIGINSGEMVVGNMGTEKMKNYTMMGNHVNLAARLEGVNKQYQTWVLLSEYTKNKIGPEFFTRSLDRVRVVGNQNSPEALRTDWYD
jgi:adenylate cyclase